MTSALERKLIVITGKGGVGKTTLAAAVGLLAARHGRRTIVVELTGAGSDAAAAGRLAALLGHPAPPQQGVETQLAENLWALSIDRDRVLAEWLRDIGGRVPARVLTSSASFQYLIAAAPGAREMTAMVKLWELAHGRRPGGAYGAPRDYDLVVLDAPATGHALALLRSPQLFTAIARVGPVARQARQVRELFEDPALSAYVAVAQATEMASSETLELSAQLRRELGRELHAVIVNGALPRRFAGEDLQRLAALGERLRPARRPPAQQSTRTRSAAVTRAAAHAAHAAHARTRAQQGQIARLRRSGLKVLTVPFSFQSTLDRATLERIAARLEGRL
jgi:anion-transporting  ArsA/GET3 family ATPase